MQNKNAESAPWAHLILIPMMALGIAVAIPLDSVASPGKQTVSERTPAASDYTYLRGVNIMDLGMGKSVVPGVFNQHYTMTKADNFVALAGRGHKVVRLPILWERIQPKLGGPLDAEYLGRLLQNLRDADAAGLKAIIDMHNYGRYAIMSEGKMVDTFIGDTVVPMGPTHDQFVDVWTKISKAVRNDAAAYRGTYAYDLMNEPNGIPDFYPALKRKATIANFEASLNGWSILYKNDPISLDRIKRGDRTSMRIMFPIKQRSTEEVYSFSVHKSKVAIQKANGNVIQVKGHIPSETEGKVRVRFVLVDSESKIHVTSPETMRKGRNDVAFNIKLPDAGLKDVSLLILQLFVSETKGSSPSPQYVYFDEINQGTAEETTRGKEVYISFVQAVVDGIRKSGDKKLIHVEGVSWASADRWPKEHPTKFIEDPANNIMYHAHLYLDHDATGFYQRTLEQEIALAKKSGYASIGARAVARAKNFADWCTREKVRCFIGEYGWPNSDWAGGADSRVWDEAGEELLTYLDSQKMGATAWATGTWLKAAGNVVNTYVLNYSTTRKFTPLSNALVIERHPSK